MLITTIDFFLLDNCIIFFRGLEGFKYYRACIYHCDLLIRRSFHIDVHEKILLFLLNNKLICSIHHGVCVYQKWFDACAGRDRCLCKKIAGATERQHDAVSEMHGK
jgi:hypothetical protein